ncbi:aldolase/citrate lyase family protein [Streptomyces sp. NBC_00006]|uniref:HpcH/HpaI aldolase family protein n=1 Tax=unclassified Streptomyces TaxID=2593676 RepID=UPI0022595609|nr:MULTISPECIES: aldolase/citrate lyase family protein [unclassified Streptomyces]MCX4835095.1 aldolase/citrate lyase family protein [Streptomyces sp. NBC_01016]MCX5529028.1 aldolase/citrate lyase family protein [Streptomyces sp. NBC_00006]
MTVPRTPRRSLKQRLADGESLRGGLLRLPSETLVEMAGVAGLDYVVIDCEHGPADMALLQQHILAAQAHGIDVIVRVGTAEPALALRALDLGAAGLIHPHVDSAEDARRAVAASHYPPWGERGFATYSRSGRFGTVTAAEHVAASRETLVIPMIETQRACAAADEIAGTEGVDAVLVGPADLAADCGFPAPEVVNGLVQEAHRATAKNGRTVMTIVPHLEAAQAAEEAGSRLIVFNMAQVLMDTMGALAHRPDRDTPSS